MESGSRSAKHAEEQGRNRWVDDSRAHLFSLLRVCFCFPPAVRAPSPLPLAAAPKAQNPEEKMERRRGLVQAGASPVFQKERQRHALATPTRRGDLSTMADEAEGAGVGEQQAAAPSRRLRRRYLPDDLIRSILLGLTPKALLRCRAHHLRQPAQPLLLVHRTAGDDVESRLLAFLRYCLEAVDLRRRIGIAEPPLRTVVRFQDTEYIDRSVFDALEVRGSCDGLLLLSRLDAFFVCNPATQLPARVVIAGFYPYGPSASREYRVLYLHGGVGKRRCYVLTEHRAPLVVIGFRERRSAHLGHKSGRPSPRQPVWLHDDNILVFDTEVEDFGWMRPPTSRTNSFLFETEGRLALSCYEQYERRVYLWIKQEYENNVIWACRYQIELPAMQRGNLLRTYRPGGPFITFTRHVLKESLAWRGGGADEPPFFDGL
nr:unnamed protein product [Digitaria exilis]